MPHKELGPRQVNKRGNENLPRDAGTVPYEVASVTGRRSLTDRDVGQASIDSKGVGFNLDESDDALTRRALREDSHDDSTRREWQLQSGRISE